MNTVDVQRPDAGYVYPERAGLPSGTTKATEQVLRNTSAPSISTPPQDAMSLLTGLHVPSRPEEILGLILQLAQTFGANNATTMQTMARLIKQAAIDPSNPPQMIARIIDLIASTTPETQGNQGLFDKLRASWAQWKAQPSTPSNGKIPDELATWIDRALKALEQNATPPGALRPPQSPNQQHTPQTQPNAPPSQPSTNTRQPPVQPPQTGLPGASDQPGQPSPPLPEHSPPQAPNAQPIPARPQAPQNTGPRPNVSLPSQQTPPSGLSPPPPAQSPLRGSQPTPNPSTPPPNLNAPTPPSNANHPGLSTGKPDAQQPAQATPAPSGTANHNAGSSPPSASQPGTPSAGTASPQPLPTQVHLPHPTQGPTARSERAESHPLQFPLESDAPPLPQPPNQRAPLPPNTTPPQADTRPQTTPNQPEDPLTTPGTTSAQPAPTRTPQRPGGDPPTALRMAPQASAEAAPTGTQPASHLAPSSNWSGPLPLDLDGKLVPGWLDLEWQPESQVDERGAHGDDQEQCPRPKALSIHLTSEALGPLSFHLAWLPDELVGSIAIERPEVAQEANVELPMLASRLRAAGSPKVSLQVTARNATYEDR